MLNVLRTSKNLVVEHMLSQFFLTLFEHHLLFLRGYTLASIPSRQSPNLLFCMHFSHFEDLNKSKNKLACRGWKYGQLLLTYSFFDLVITCLLSSLIVHLSLPLLAEGQPGLDRFSCGLEGQLRFSVLARRYKVATISKINKLNKELNKL